MLNVVSGVEANAFSKLFGGSGRVFLVVIQFYRAFAALFHKSPSLASDPALFIRAIYKRFAAVNSFFCCLVQYDAGAQKSFL